MTGRLANSGGIGFGLVLTAENPEEGITVNTAITNKLGMDLFRNIMTSFF
jgi:hypothetical protein